MNEVHRCAFPQLRSKFPSLTLTYGRPVSSLFFLSLSLIWASIVSAAIQGTYTGCQSTNHWSQCEWTSFTNDWSGSQFLFSFLWGQDWIISTSSRQQNVGLWPQERKKKQEIRKVRDNRHWRPLRGHGFMSPYGPAIRLSPSHISCYTQCVDMSVATAARSKSLFLFVFVMFWPLSRFAQSYTCVYTVLYAKRLSFCNPGHEYLVH